jgi:hypothetical protein
LVVAYTAESVTPEGFMKEISPNEEFIEWAWNNGFGYIASDGLLSLFNRAVDLVHTRTDVNTLRDSICDSVIRALGVMAYRTPFMRGEVPFENIPGLAIREYHNDPLFNRVAQNAVHEILKAFDESTNPRPIGLKRKNETI